MVLVFVSLSNVKHTQHITHTIYIHISRYTLLYSTTLSYHYRQCAGYGERGDPTGEEGRDGRGAGVVDRC